MSVIETEVDVIHKKILIVKCHRELRWSWIFKTHWFGQFVSAVRNLCILKPSKKGACFIQTRDSSIFLLVSFWRRSPFARAKKPFASRYFIRPQNSGINGSACCSSCCAKTAENCRRFMCAMKLRIDKKQNPAYLFWCGLYCFLSFSFRNHDNRFWTGRSRSADTETWRKIKSERILLDLRVLFSWQPRSWPSRPISLRIFLIVLTSRSMNTETWRGN